MSETTFWKWLKPKIESVQGVHGVRLEGCNTAGVPDTVIHVRTGNNVFMELKDWSTSPRHPLLVQQKNFLTTFNGFVAVKHIGVISLVLPGTELTPLLVADANYVLDISPMFNIKKFCPTEFILYLETSYG